MLEIHPEDFCPLETFVLQWRWTNPRRVLLPKDILDAIHPLRPEKAEELYDLIVFTKAYTELYEDLHPSQCLSDQSLSVFTSKRSFHMAHVPAEAREDVLVKLDIEKDAPVFVSWEPSIALVTKWAVLHQYWYDFCYPASDDVDIAPLSQEWLMIWDHDEQIAFGKI